MSKNSNKMLAFKNKYRFIMCSAMITISNFSDAYEQRLHLLISGCYSRCMDMRVLQRGSSFGAGVPIGASSIPIGRGISKGTSVSLCLGCSEGITFPFDRKNPKKPAVSWHTIFRRKV